MWRRNDVPHRRVTRLLESQLFIYIFPKTWRIVYTRTKRWLEIRGTLRSNDADGIENVKKTIGFIRKTTTLNVHHAFLYIS